MAILKKNLSTPIDMEQKKTCERIQSAWPVVIQYLLLCGGSPNMGRDKSQTQYLKPGCESSPIQAGRLK